MKKGKKKKRREKNTQTKYKNRELNEERISKTKKSVFSIQYERICYRNGCSKTKTLVKSNAIWHLQCAGMHERL